MKEVAYPYAEAVFEYADENHQIAEWQTMLSWLAELIKQPTIHQLLVNPTYDTTTQSEIVFDFSQNKLNNVGQNFVRILGKNHRLTVLPDIQILFERYVAETNQRINATVTSAIQLNEN